MMTPSKNYLTIIFFSLLAFTFTACQTGISDAVDEGPAIQLQEPTQDEESPCYGQESEQGFDLERAAVTTTPSALGTPQTVGHLELIPNHGYSVASSCMCYVEKYVLTFDEYPDPIYTAYTNNAGDQIYPIGIYTVLTTDPNTNQTTITGYNATFGLSDLDEGIYFGFDDDLDPQPMMLQAGGLCMVDNIGAPMPDSTLKVTGPWEVIVTDKQGFRSTRYGIPTSESSGSHNLVPRQ